MPLTAEEEVLLSKVKKQLVGTSKFDFGNMKGATPIVIEPNSFRPCRRHGSPEAVEGIAPVLQSLIENGAIVECPHFPCRKA